MAFTITERKGLPSLKISTLIPFFRLPQSLIAVTIQSFFDIIFCFKSYSTNVNASSDKRRRLGNKMFLEFRMIREINYWVNMNKFFFDNFLTFYTI